MKLYTVPGACSMACDIVLEEAGIAFERVNLSFDKGDLETAAFMKVNPLGAVPALEIEPGQYLTEGTAIMQYIADQKPEANLFPKTGTAHYRGLEWMNFIASELHRFCFTNIFSVERWFHDEKTQASFTQNMTTELNFRLDHVNTQLEGKKFCLGETFSICDAYLFTVLSWAKHIDHDLTPWKNITAHQARVFERPGVQTAMKGEGLLK